MIRAQFQETFESWRSEARRLILSDVKPDFIQWNRVEDDLFLQDENEFLKTCESTKRFNISPRFLQMADFVASARFPDRWSLLYRLLYRQIHEKRDLLQVCVDRDVRMFQLLYQSVRRDIHKMHAFVRFKKVIMEDHESYLAWHMPEHLIVEKGATFFVRRFGDKPWSIFTPDRSAHWDTERLLFSEGIPQNQFPHLDDFDEVWKTYYRSIFNPARVMIKAMKKEFSPKYWRSLPEAALIPELIRGAPARLQQMALQQNTQVVVDKKLSLPELKESAKSCQACPLYSKATGTVFGEGPETAKIMIVGEQPGDKDDLAGKPFVGPAGQMLNECLELAGINRSELYITNAVKHFKWIYSDGNRLHRRASGSEMHACLPWLETEIEKVRPDVIIGLGVTAGTAILGKLPKLSKERGKILGSARSKGIVLSWHPSAILRSMSEDEKRIRKSELIQDLKLAFEFSKKAA